MDALSPQEQQALEILSGYGVDFGPVYIGRARRIIWQQAALKGSMSPEQFEPKDPVAQPATCDPQKIVDCVIGLINLDENQREYIQHPTRQKELSGLYETVSLSEPDRLNNIELLHALRQLVDLERAKLAAQNPAALKKTEPIRFTLYQDKVKRHKHGGPFIGSCSIFQFKFIIKAAYSHKLDALNVELTPSQI